MALMGAQESMRTQAALVNQANNEVMQANQSISNANAALQQSMLEQEAEQIKRRDADAMVRAQILEASQRDKPSFSNMKNFTSLKPLLNITEGSISSKRSTPPVNTNYSTYSAAVNQPHNQN